MVITGTELRRRGLSTRRTAVTLGVAEVVSAAAMAALAAINIFAAASFADLPSGTVVPLLGAAVVTLVAVGIVDLLAGRRQIAEWIAVVIGALCWWRPRPSVASRRAAGAAWHAEATSVLGPQANRAVLVTISAAAWVADVCCCYCALAAFGITVPFDVVLLAYTIGVLATLVRSSPPVSDSSKPRCPSCCKASVSRWAPRSQRSSSTAASAPCCRRRSDWRASPGCASRGARPRAPRLRFWSPAGSRSIRASSSCARLPTD